MTYPDSVQYLFSLGNEIRTIKLGLDRIRAVLAELGSPERCCPLIHVAGTNGKGSTCAMIEAGLRASGVRTGLYTSPHLVEATERIRLNGDPVSQDEFAWAFNLVHDTAMNMLERGVIDLHPTYFETATAMAFVLFREMRVQRAVIEVGLGGRLDATNVIVPELSVITPVDYDHESILGSTLREIAGEKAGILKRGIPAVVAPQRGEVMQRLMEVAGEVGTKLIPVDTRAVRNLELHVSGCRFDLDLDEGAIPVECPLAGEHQVANAATAARALYQLGVSCAGIASARWPGRLDRVSEKPEIILDGAHNPAGVRALCEHIDRFYAGRKIWLIYATMRDKSVDEIVEMLGSRAAEVIVTRVSTPRALRAEALAAMFRRPGVRLAAGLADALDIARGEAAEGDVILVTGSLFLVGEALGLLAPQGGQAVA